MAGLLALGCLAPAAGQGTSESPHGPLAEPCDACHSVSSWSDLRRPLLFDHDSTGFPLSFGHRHAACMSCHPSPVFSNVPVACADCHEDVHGADLGSACESCHEPSGWDSRRVLFERHEATLFPLTGAHASLDCASCHREEPPFEFAATPTQCLSCHLEAYEATDSPDHLKIGFPKECRQCHGTDRWRPSHFDGGPGFSHDEFFVLSGAHAGAECGSCHVAGIFAGTPNDCFSCHREEYQATDNPSHPNAGFSTACESCHTMESWLGAQFDHDQVFPLEGAHRNADCESCHVGGVYTGTPRDCYSCHQRDYDQTTAPNHMAAGFPTTCQACHTVQSWQGAQFDHDQVFALEGAHRNADCESCHVGGVYTGTPRDCYSCHQQDYDRTTDPNHAAAGFPTACQSCHSTTRWEGADFNHDDFFTLTGAHKSTTCESCHVGGVYTGTPRDCYSCHRQDYDGTTDPDHAAAGFPTACQSCHSTTRWEGATFNHDRFFELTGAHRNTTCESCHLGGVYAGTPRDCYSCHQQDYDRTTDPDHAAAGFPTACQSCHSTTRWEGATFNHDQFFHLRGDHRRLDCVECHVVPSNYQAFECIECHEHAKGQTDRDHSEVPGYVWESHACVSCHQ